MMRWACAAMSASCVTRMIVLPLAPHKLSTLASLPLRFLRHVKRQATVRFLDTTEQGTKATGNARIFSYSPLSLETNTRGIAEWSFSF